MTWLILAFNVLMASWLVFGVGGAVNDADCATQVSREACEAGMAVGAGVGAVLIIVLWALGDVILLVLWLVTRSKKRQCPACGRDAKKGQMQCRKCGHDFRQIGYPMQQAPVWQPPEQQRSAPGGRHH